MAFAFPNKEFFISTHEFSSVYSSDSLPDPAGEGVRQQLHRDWLLAKVK